MNQALPAWLAELPAALASGAAVVMIRHAERGPLIVGERGDDVPLTAAGRRAARALGGALPGALVGLRASPVARALETAECIRSGADALVRIESSSELGGPGPFVADVDLAWEAFWRLGKHRLIERLVAGPGPLAGFHDPRAAAAGLVHELLAPARRAPGLHLVVSHDLIIAALVGVLRRRVLADDAWPGYLEGVVFEVVGGRVRWRYRGEDGLVSD